MTKENTDLQLIQKLGAIVEYLGELSHGKPPLYSEELLPASRKEIENAVTQLSLLTTNDSDKELLQKVRPLLDFFIPHGDAVKLTLKGGSPDENDKKECAEIVQKHTSKWKA